MAGITREFLNDLGVVMDEQTFTAFSDHFDESLHERVIDRIVHTISEEQTHELAQMRGVNSDIVWEWLQANVPNLNEIVQQEVDTMLAEVVRTSDHL